MYFKQLSRVRPTAHYNKYSYKVGALGAPYVECRSGSEKCGVNVNIRGKIEHVQHDKRLARTAGIG